MLQKINLLWNSVVVVCILAIWLKVNTDYNLYFAGIVSLSFIQSIISKEICMVFSKDQIRKELLSSLDGNYEDLKFFLSEEFILSFVQRLMFLLLFIELATIVYAVAPYISQWV